MLFDAHPEVKTPIGAIEKAAIITIKPAGAEEAANLLSEEGIECEIIDPRTYSPLDETLIYESVKKTGKVIIIYESNPKCSIASQTDS